MNNRQYVIWRYDSPAVDVLDADEAELIYAAQIADFLSSPCASGCTTLDEASGLGQGRQ